MCRNERAERVRRAHEQRQTIAAPIVLAVAVVIASVALSYPLWFVSTHAPRLYTAVVVIVAAVLFVHGLRKGADTHR